jgi:hypothetical protein
MEGHDNTTDWEVLSHGRTHTQRVPGTVVLPHQVRSLPALYLLILEHLESLPRNSSR